MSEFSELVGKTLSKIEVGHDQIDFWDQDGHQYRLYHSQDCCESVYVESIVGDITALLHAPVLVAEEASSDTNPPDASEEETRYQESFTWTFYKLATIKGSVDIRWYGSSNGYYSERVDFVDLAA